MIQSIPAQEIKRRGVSAIDDAIAGGAVHVIRHNRPAYVVLTPERYEELLEAEEEAAAARTREALADHAAGRSRVLGADAAIRELDLYG